MKTFIKGLNFLRDYLNSIKKQQWVSFFISFYIIGAVGLLFPYSQSFFIWLIPLSLLFNLLVLLHFHQKWERKHIGLFVGITVMGFFIEVAGVNTGIVFGKYHYDYALGFEIFETPLIIGINWLLLIYCTYILMSRIKIHAILKNLLGSSVMLGYDIILEPVAIKLSMWHWLSDAIPLRNYAAWFVISSVMFAILQVFKVKFSNSLALVILFSQFGFFLILNLGFKLLYP